MAEKKKNILQPILVGLLVIASFAIGSMWTQIKTLKTNKAAEQAPTAQQQQQPQEPTEVGADVWKTMIANPVAVKGDENAKVTLVEFTDYQCPFCKRYVDQTKAQIEKDYVATGKVRYILRDLPLPFHQNAQKAAEAVKCAGAKGKYWEMHDLMFKNQDIWSGSTDAATVFTGYAGTVGLNSAKFSGCLTNGEQKAAVDQDAALAQKAGLGGTPSFVINGKILVGAQPYEQFKAAIDAALR